jgi:hypothetical protein
MPSELLFKSAYFHALASEKNDFFSAILKIFEGFRTHMEEMISEMLGTDEGKVIVHHPDMVQLFKLLTDLFVGFDPEMSTLKKAVFFAGELQRIMEVNEAVRDRFGTKHGDVENFTGALRGAIRGVVPILTEYYEKNLKQVAI